MYIDKSPRGARVSGKKFPVEDKKKASPEGSRSLRKRMRLLLFPAKGCGGGGVYTGKNEPVVGLNAGERT